MEACISHVFSCVSNMQKMEKVKYLVNIFSLDALSFITSIAVLAAGLTRAGKCDLFIYFSKNRCVEFWTRSEHCKESVKLPHFLSGLSRVE